MSKQGVRGVAGHERMKMICKNVKLFLREPLEYFRKRLTYKNQDDKTRLMDALRNAGLN